MATNTHISAGRIVVMAISMVFLSCAWTGNAAASAYGWPLKPFHQQHAVRGFFGDPRIDWEIPHVQRAYRFHFGVVSLRRTARRCRPPLRGGSSFRTKRLS
jgi:hypothetical protein